MHGLCHALERRVLFAASPGADPTINIAASAAPAWIQGRVFSDFNRDGTFDSDERGLGKRLVWVDLNNNGARDAREPAHLTGPDGRYVLRTPAPGQYVVRTVVGPSVLATAPADARHAAQSATAVTEMYDFGLASKTAKPTGSISGSFYYDRDTDDRYEPSRGEEGVGGRSVFLDFNGNRAREANEPIAVTDSLGRYRFARLPLGRYFVQPVADDNDPAPPRQAAVVAAAAPVAAVHFAVDPGPPAGTASIQGLVIRDVNSNGIFDAGDTPFEGMSVHLDPNNNGLHDPGERSSVADANGRYYIGGLAAGPTVMRMVFVGGGYSAKDPIRPITLQEGEAVSDQDFVVKVLPTT